MPAIAIAGIGVASSIAGGAMGASAASNAADTAAKGQIEAAKISAASQEKMYNQTRGDQLPYLTAGAGAAGRLDYLLGLPGPQTSTQNAFKAGYGPQGTAYLPGTGGVPGQAPVNGAAPAPVGYRPQQGAGAKALQLGGGFDTPIGYRGGINPNAAAAQPQVPGVVDPSYGSLLKDFSASDFQTDPGYAFRLSEGQKALDRSAAARGGLFSGETLKANDQYNQNFASNEFSNAYNRFQNNRTTKYNFLSNAAGGGQIAANNLSSVGAQYGTNIGNTLQQGYGNAANARASGYIGAGNAWNGAISGVGNAVNGYLNTRI